MPTPHTRSVGWRTAHVLLLLTACTTSDIITLPDLGAPIAPISDVPGATRWSYIAAGSSTNCATDEAGLAFCWGRNWAPTCTEPGCDLDLRPRQVAGAPPFVAVETSGQIACGRTATGAMSCWGSATGSSLGDGTTVTSAVPVPVPIPGGVAQIATGFERTCALNTAGAIYCWGAGRAALGAGPDVVESLVPLRVNASVTFTTVSVGTTQTCAIDVANDAWCWGSGFGSLGIGERDTSCSVGPSCHAASTPERVAGGLKWAHLSAGNAFTCGVTLDALGYCWGDVRSSTDPYGPLGLLGSGALRGSLVPLAVAGGHRFRSIHAGVRHACGLTTDGAAYCWGLNNSGQLGNGRFDPLAYLPSSTGRQHTPQPVVGGLRFTRLAVGETSCGVTVAGNLFCWGLNGAGLLGIGSLTVNVVAVPTRVADPVGRTP